MKTNIKRVNYDNIPNKNGKWWLWLETCDRCGKEIRNNNDWMSSEKPNINKLDFCNDCYRYLFDNDISYEEAKKIYKNKN